MRKLLAAVLVVCVMGSLFGLNVMGDEVVELGTYVVVFQEDVNPDEAAQGLRNRLGVELGGIYRHALKGVVVHADSKQVESILADPAVLLVERNQLYAIDQGAVVPTGIQRIFADENPNLDIDYVDDVRVNADVAVLDTGIDFDHPDLNLAMAIDCTWSGPKEGTCAGTRDDGHGHGTHVAGTIGALDNSFGVVGVAPGVRLWAVKVLTNYGTGTTAQVIAGIDWVADRADQIEVANMSLGGSGESDAMDLAITGAAEAGVTFSLSAGNRSKDVNDYHPAGHPDAITVSALADYDGLPGGLSEPSCSVVDVDDTLADFSNYGTGVTLIAPGVCIYSTYLDGRYVTMSGTSMAAPHAAGAAAILASAADHTPAEIRSILTAEGNYGWLDESPDGIQEPLLDLSDPAVFAPVTVPSVALITLNALPYRVSGWQFTDLTWSGATSASIDVYRDGSLVATTENDGAYTDEVGENGAGMHFYWICQTGDPVACSRALIVYY